jgi:hypothetical protein
MNIFALIFFFGVAVTLIVLKGLFMSREFSARSRRVRKAQRQGDVADVT